MGGEKAEWTGKGKEKGDERKKGKRVEKGGKDKVERSLGEHKPRRDQVEKTA